MTRGRRPWWLLATIPLATLGCGINDESAADPIEGAEFDLRTTTESTAVPTVPDGTVDATAPSESTVTPAPPEPFTAYFVRASGLVAVEIDLPAAPSLRDVVDGIAAGPPDASADDGARSLVADGLVRSLTLRDHVLTIDLDLAVFELVDASEQRLLIGQLVLSLSEHPGVDGITAWRFTIDGEPLPVNRRDGTLSQPGVPVTRADYDLLVET